MFFFVNLQCTAPHTVQNWWIIPKKDTERPLALKRLYHNPSLSLYRFWNNPTPNKFCSLVQWYSHILEILVIFDQFHDILSCWSSYYIYPFEILCIVHVYFVFDLLSKYAYPKWNFFRIFWIVWHITAIIGLS